MPRVTLTDEQAGFLRSLVAASEDRMEQQLLSLQSLDPSLLSEAGKQQMNGLVKGLQLIAETMIALNRQPGRPRRAKSEAGSEAGDDDAADSSGV